MQRSEKEVEDLLEKAYSELLKVLMVKIDNNIDGRILINDPLEIKKYIRAIYLIGYDDGCLDRAGAKKVIAYKDGENNIPFRSVVHAASYFEVNQGSIQTSIREGTKCKGYNFKFKL
jgi:hypothetical protein